MVACTLSIRLDITGSEEGSPDKYYSFFAQEFRSSIVTERRKKEGGKVDF